MIVVMPTVRHTGSQYLRQLLRSALPEHTLRSEPDHGFMTDHAYASHMEHLLVWLESADLMVIPVRHPQLVASSWSCSSPETFIQKYWRDQWRNLEVMLGRAKELDVYTIVVPVDEKGSKYRYLNALSGRLEVKFPDELLCNIENPGRLKYRHDYDPDWEEQMQIPFIKDLYQKDEQ